MVRTCSLYLGQPVKEIYLTPVSPSYVIPSVCRGKSTMHGAAAGRVLSFVTLRRHNPYVTWFRATPRARLMMPIIAQYVGNCAIRRIAASEKKKRSYIETATHGAIKISRPINDDEVSVTRYHHNAMYKIR